uniref:Uncharacterized protein n=1 Tax=viral metagenome TaxID=1070528 RepID=A0A6M3L3L0_9ZZZZ
MCSRLSFKQGNITRQESLSYGKQVVFSTAAGTIIKGVFAGNLRAERFNAYWKQRTAKIHVIPVKGFSEGRNRNMKHFEVKIGSAVVVAEMKNGELRMATQPAAHGVERVHDRMPFLVTENYQPKTNIKK